LSGPGGPKGEGEGEGKGDQAPSLLIPLTIAAGFFMEGLDSTIIGASLPQIAASFQTPATAIAAAITSYLLSLAVFIPMTGWFAERFGARRAYALATVVFTLGSVLCGLAPSPLALVLSRMLQGLGGAMMVPVGRLILARSFPKDQLIRAMSFMIIPGLVGPMMGPVVGGWITTYASWRWVFFINVPLGAVSLAMTLAFLKVIPAERPPRFDWAGFLLCAAGLAALQVGLDSLSSRQGPSPMSAILGAAALGALGCYVLHARRATSPIIDISLFRLRVFAVATGAGHLARMGLAAAPFLAPLLFQAAFGLSAFQSGLLTFAMAGGQIVMRFAVPGMLRRGGVKPVLIAATLAGAAMTAGMALFGSSTPHAVILAYLLVLGLVQCVIYSVVGALGFSGIPAERASQATTITAISQRLSAGMGVAISAWLLHLASGGRPLAAPDFLPAFLTMALVLAAGLVGFLALKPEDGRDLAPAG
jgi:EmrB/QacA subfamily drug resistance transporter